MPFVNFFLPVPWGFLLVKLYCMRKTISNFRLLEFLIFCMDITNTWEKFKQFGFLYYGAGGGGGGEVEGQTDNITDVPNASKSLCMFMEHCRMGNLVTSFLFQVATLVIQ